MKSLIYKSILLLLVMVTATSCFNKNSRNYQYFPNMYISPSYETYGEYNIFENQQEAKTPVEGTIPRGWMPYEYPNTNEGYEQAKAELKNPIPYTKENLENGKELFNIYCAICHGEKGNGKGVLVQREKILGVPQYDDPGRAITEGSIYHVMYYGKNAMGSYAAQTSIHERWQIDHYVMSLKAALQGKPAREFVTDSVKRLTETQMRENRKNLVPAVNARPGVMIDQHLQAKESNQVEKQTN